MMNNKRVAAVEQQVIQSSTTTKDNDPNAGSSIENDEVPLHLQRDQDEEESEDQISDENDDQE